MCVRANGCLKKCLNIYVLLYNGALWWTKNPCSCRIPKKKSIHENGCFFLVF
uniref:Uncharacterized protein n=1 Tax=Siphoviridae sp. ct91l7 TaxID=2826173 RepID=A0A8S5MWV6_9CAUD|nr:MAG TPA: hypothetical protein [Siphoviridae sp. ct91l7]